MSEGWEGLSEPPHTAEEYRTQKDGLDSWLLANATIRKKKMLQGKYPPNDRDEARWLDWE